MQNVAPSLSQILRPREAAARLGIHRTTLWRAVRRGELPPPLHITRGAVGWPESVLVEFLARGAANPASR